MAGPFDHRIPSGPLERDPTSRHLTTDEQRELLLGALDGIELGVWDRSIVEWLSAYDAATVLTVCSLIRRVRLHVRPKRLTRILEQLSLTPASPVAEASIPLLPSQWAATAVGG